MSHLHLIISLLCNTVLVADNMIRMSMFLGRMGSLSNVMHPLVELRLDNTDVKALIDTGAPYSFFIWETWYEGAHNRSCESTIYKCYECNPAPCQPGHGQALPFADGSRVMIFLHTTSINFGTKTAHEMSIGLVSGFVPAGQSQSVWASLGLRAPWSSMYPHYKTIIEQLLAQPAAVRLIDSSSFSVYMKADEHPSGELILGGQDPTKYDGLLEYIKVVNDDEQYINLFGIKVGKEKQLEFKVSTILDTGSPKVLFHDTLKRQILQLIRIASKNKVDISTESGEFVIPCVQAKFLPAITFYLEGLQEEVNQGVPLEVPGLSLLNKVSEDKCFLNIDFGEDPGFVIGLPAFIGNYYFYELDNSRIGLAKTRS